MGVSRLFSCVTFQCHATSTGCHCFFGIYPIKHLLLHYPPLCLCQYISRIIISPKYVYIQCCWPVFLIVGCQVSETSKSQIHHESALTGVAYQRFERWNTLHLERSLKIALGLIERLKVVETKTVNGQWQLPLRIIHPLYHSQLWVEEDERKGHVLKLGIKPHVWVVGRSEGCRWRCTLTSTVHLYPTPWFRC